MQEQRKWLYKATLRNLDMSGMNQYIRKTYLDYHTSMKKNHQLRQLERRFIPGILLWWNCRIKLNNEETYDYHPRDTYVKSVSGEKSLHLSPRAEMNNVFISLNENK